MRGQVSKEMLEDGEDNRRCSGVCQEGWGGGKVCVH
jgi:hypothetical protein